MHNGEVLSVRPHVSSPKLLGGFLRNLVLGYSTVKVVNTNFHWYISVQYETHFTYNTDRTSFSYEGFIIRNIYK
jgi:hypothetical protein